MVENIIHDPTFWVAIAFIIFVALLYRPITSFVGKGLDKRAARIESELDEARRLREEAQALLAEYEKKQRQVEEEAKLLLKSAREDVERMKKEASAKLQETIEKRTALAEERIAKEEEKAIQDVQKQVVNVAMFAAQTAIMENLTKEADDSLITLAIDNVNRIVH